MKYYVSTTKDNIEHLSNKKINNLNINNNNLTFETNEKSLQLLLKNIAELSYYNKRKIKIICFIKKYCISIICLIILFLFLINEQFVIKKIEFINENTYNQEVINYLYNNKLDKRVIYYYLNDSLTNINKQLKQEFYYYEWININKKGNVLQVVIDKQDEKSYLNESSNIIGDIISNKDGIIRYFFIKKGVNLIKDGQSVKKGDVLVSGNLLIKNDKIDYIHPVGIILAEVVEEEYVKVKKINTDYIRTGKIEIKENIYFFNLNNNKKKCKFDIYEEDVFNIINNKIIKKDKIVYYEIKEVSNYYNEEDAMKYSYSIIEKKFNENKVHDKERILEHFLLYTNEDNDYYYFKYLVKKIVNISEFKAVNLEDN